MVSRDTQVFAHLITHPLVCAQLRDVRKQLNQKQLTWSYDWCDMRLLDAVLWMQAMRPPSSDLAPSVASGSVYGTTGDCADLEQT